MKTLLILLLLGAIGGAVGWHYYQNSRPVAVTGATTVAVDWKLTPQNIKAELARTGRVVRSKARLVGERIDDARIIAVIKGKYIVDNNLSVFAISVDCRDGDVKLTGSVTAEEYIARAVTLALQTHGVQNVISLITVKN